MLRKPLLIVFVALLAGACAAQAASSSLFEDFSRQKDLRIYVAEPSAASGQIALDPALVKSSIEKALEKRKSVNFRVVPSEAEAEWVIQSELKAFVFSLTDPMDMLIGVTGAAIDAAVQDHFATTEAVFAVRKANAKQAAWSDKLKASVTHHTMTEEESKLKVSEKLAEMLMRSAFGKKKR